MFKNKFKKLTGLFLAAVMTLVALPIQTLASDWVSVSMFMRLCSEITSAQTVRLMQISIITTISTISQTAV